jgi:hypothetical protein
MRTMERDAIKSRTSMDSALSSVLSEPWLDSAVSDRACSGRAHQSGAAAVCDGFMLDKLWTNKLVVLNYW